MPIHDDNLDDETLVLRIQQGVEVEANFRRLFDRYYASVIQFFRNQGFQEQDASDLTQDAFLRVYRSVEQFRHDARFRTWLLTIVGNVWRNELRRLHSGKREARQVSLDETTEEGQKALEIPDGSVAEPLTRLQEEERMKDVQKAVESLPPQMRRCVLLRAQGLKYREIADILQISIETVKSQLHQAKQRLRELLGDDDHDDDPEL
ncbi:MAG TPA: sigma-70 family RNA polymerase sigma factor [Thermoanaerobaculia bacterium]|nr:sigma-70 family RNA polymerase sigma factor [Thermoanaerobaculia bacterium]